MKELGAQRQVRYTVETVCEKCGGMERYTANHDCVRCVYLRNIRRMESGLRTAAEIMQRMNEQRKSPQEIADYLNARGLKNRNGNAFFARNVVSMMQEQGWEVLNMPDNLPFVDRHLEADRPVRKRVNMSGADYSQYEVPADIDRFGRIYA